MPRVRAVLVNALLVLGSVLAGLVLLEAATWLIYPPPSPHPLPPNLMTAASGVWTLTPDFRGVMDNRVDFRGAVVTVDGRGVRRAPPPASEPKRRIFVLGDSQTFGHGLPDDQTWPARLQRALDASRPGIQVENWGVPAINIDQYAARLERVLAVARPGDAVLAGISWNDLITPQDRNEVMRVVEGYLVTGSAKNDGEASPRDGGTEAEVAARLRLYDYTGVVIPPYQDLKQFAEVFAANSALASLLMPRLRALWHRWRSSTPLTQIVAEKVPEANFWLLNDMKRRAAAKGVAFAVVLLPERYFVVDSMYAAYSGGGRFFPEQNFMGYLTRPLCASFDLVCIDPFPVLHRHQHAPIYFRIDGHYNARGAELIGDHVAEQLAQVLN